MYDNVSCIMYVCVYCVCVCTQGKKHPVSNGISPNSVDLLCIVLKWPQLEITSVRTPIKHSRKVLTFNYNSCVVHFLNVHSSFNMSPASLAFKSKTVTKLSFSLSLSLSLHNYNYNCFFRYDGRCVLCWTQSYS